MFTVLNRILKRETEKEISIDIRSRDQVFAKKDSTFGTTSRPTGASLFQESLQRNVRA